MEKAAEEFLLLICAFVPQVVIFGLLLGKCIQKYPAWVEKSSASGKAKL